MSSLPEMPLTVYTSESRMRHPLTLIREMGADLIASRELAWRLFVRDISAMYRQSFLGYFWAFAPALLMALPFVFLESQGIVKVPGTGLPYAAFAMVSTILWQIFVDALNAPIKAVTGGRAMLSRINFPRESLILAGVADILFNFLIRLVVLAGVMIGFRIALGPDPWFFCVGVVALMMSGLSLGLLLAPAGALYGDVGRALGVFTGVWMLLTPVVYPPKTEGIAGFLATWNPVSPLMVVTRGGLVGGEFAGSLPGFWVVSGLSLVLFLAGWVLYRVTMPILIERMG